MTDKVPKELDWVKERAECSLLGIFQSLQAGVEADVREMKELFKARAGLRFEFHAHNNHQFSVTRMDDPNLPIGESVSFVMGAHDITVHSRDHAGSKKLFSATVTLDDDGNCKLLIDGASLEQWQVRRRALEFAILLSVIEACAPASTVKDYNALVSHNFPVSSAKVRRLPTMLRMAISNLSASAILFFLVARLLKRNTCSSR